MKTRLAAVTVALLMCLGLLAGASAQAEYPEEMTFSVVTTSQETFDNPTTNLFAKALKDKFNVVLNFEYIPNSDLEETLKLRMVGGEDPDVFFGLNLTQQFEELGAEGYYVPLNDYLEKLPNYRALWSDEDWATFLDLSSASDGKLYSLHVPMSGVQLIGEGWIFRMGTLEKLGLKVPTTTDGLYETLKAIKAAYPDSIPFANRNKLNWLLYGFEDAFRTDTGYRVDPDSGEFVYGPVTQKYREMLIYLNKLYKEDLIYKEFATATSQQWSELLAQGKVHVIFDYFAREAWANNLMKDVDPDANWKASFDYIRAYPEKKQFVTRYSPVGGVAARISSRNSPERIERLVAIFDWLATEEGMIATQFGEKGLTYDIVDGQLVYTPMMITPLNPGQGTDTLLKYDLGYRLAIHPTFWHYQGADTSREVGNYAVDNGFEYYRHFTLKFSDEDKTVVSDYGTVVNDIQQEYGVKFIMGQLDPNDDAAWNAYVDTISKGGLDKVLPIYQRYYAEKYDK